MAALARSLALQLLLPTLLGGSGRGGRGNIAITGGRRKRRKRVYDEHGCRSVFIKRHRRTVCKRGR